MPFQWISQEKLIWDWDLNPREKDESHVRVIASHMNENGYDPKRPIIVYKFEKVQEIYYAATGHHRLEASLLRDVEFPNLPLSEVFVELIEGTHAEYVRRMLIDNFQHLPGFNKGIGKMPDRFEIKAMRSRLLFFPDVFLQGDRLLAKNWGCDRDTVSKLREGFISEVNNPNDFVDESSFHAKGDFEKIQKIIEDDLYTGIDGKKYPRTTKPAKRTETKESDTDEVGPQPELVEETLPEESQDEELDADLKEKLTDIFTLHGSIPIYNPSSQKSYSEELAQDSSLSAVDVHIQIRKFKAHIHDLEKGVKKSLRQDPSWKPDSLACAMMEDVEVVKTIMANIASRQEFDKQWQGKEETPASAIVPEPDATDLLIKGIWSELPLWRERHEGKRIDYAQPFMLVEAARREMQELWDYDDETPGCATELKGDATLEELTYVIECMKENNNRFIDAVRFVMFGDEDEEESDESKPVEETLVPKASETKVLKIQGMTIYIDNPDSSKSFRTAVHFSEKKSEDFKDHLISDIPSDVLAELERVANEILLNKETEDE